MGYLLGLHNLLAAQKWDWTLLLASDPPLGPLVSLFSPMLRSTTQGAMADLKGHEALRGSWTQAQPRTSLTLKSAKLISARLLPREQ